MILMSLHVSCAAFLNLDATAHSDFEVSVVLAAHV